MFVFIGISSVILSVKLSLMAGITIRRILRWVKDKRLGCWWVIFLSYFETECNFWHCYFHKSDNCQKENWYNKVTYCKLPFGHPGNNVEWIRLIMWPIPTPTLSSLPDVLLFILLFCVSADLLRNISHCSGQWTILHSELHCSAHGSSRPAPYTSPRRWRPCSL